MSRFYLFSTSFSSLKLHLKLHLYYKRAVAGTVMLARGAVHGVCPAAPVGVCPAVPWELLGTQGRACCCCLGPGAASWVSA